MKLNRKIAIAFTLVIFSFALLFLLFENLFLDRFFVLQKKSNLHSAYEEVVEYIKNNDYDNQTLLLEIGDISSKTNTSICIFDINGFNYDLRPNVRYKNLADLNLEVTIDGISERVDKKEEYEKYISTEAYDIEFEDENESLRNIAAIGRIEKEDKTCAYLFIYTSVTTVKSNTGIFNAFTIYVTLILVVISCGISYVISSSLTKPLKDCQKKARKMANLDFSSKLEVKSKDEVGELAISINKLSDELEKSINELKEANIKLENDIKLKEKINKLKEEFISDVSHELKTPISIISGYSEALKLEDLSQDDINEYADIIIDESKRMNKLVRDLLKFTQIESGFIELAKEDFSIQDLINNVIKPNDLKIQKANINLEINLDDSTVNGDYDMIEVVFNNFFVNAINHVSENGTISVIGEIINDKYRVSVRNTGNTISIENQSRIWDSFYKIDKSRSRKYGGSGLGLSIVKSIMTTYKNDYGVYNTENEDGVVFYFELNLVEAK